MIMRFRWFLWIGLAIAVCAAIYLFAQWHETIFLNIREKTEAIKQLISSLGIWAPLVYLIGYVLRPIVFIPAVPYAILGGIVFGSLLGAVYVLIGTMCSSTLEFLLVRYFIGEKTKKFLRDKTQKISLAVAKHGFITVFLIRLIPNVAFDLQNCGLAFAPVKFSDFFYGTLLGCIPACIFYSSLGDIALDRSSYWKIGLVVSLGVCLYLLRRYLPIIIGKKKIYD